MIQELFGGGGLGGGGGGGVGGERNKFSFHGTILEGLPSSSSYPSAASTTTTTTTTTITPENLRCPRCDSANTKFCYYNNYNLTQPRHFCKTCRRYWTKGGALRNVPIGGGCRKNKTTIVSTTSGKSTTGKAKTVTSEVLRSNLGSGYNHEQSSNPILWGSPQNSQLLSLLRPTPNPNPNPNSNSLSNFVNFKDEGHMIGSHLSSESGGAVTGSFNARSLGTTDSVSQQLPIGLYTSLFRNNQHQPQQPQQNQYHHQHQQSLGHGDVQNAGIQELYHRLKSSLNYYPDHSSAALSNATSMPTSLSMVEPASITGGELGGWNPQYSWSDLPTTNGAFP